MTFVFLFLTYFILYNRLEVHPPHQMCAFDGWVIFHCIYVLQLLYPFIFWWTSMLLPCPRYYKQCCSKHWGIWVFFWLWFPKILISVLMGTYPGVEFLDHMVAQHVIFPILCSIAAYHFTFLPTVVLHIFINACNFFVFQ